MITKILIAYYVFSVLWCTEKLFNNAKAKEQIDRYFQQIILITNGIPYYMQVIMLVFALLMVSPFVLAKKIFRLLTFKK